MEKRGKAAKNHRARGRASLSDILGQPGKNGKIHAKWVEHRKVLSELREHFSGKKGSRTENAKQNLPSFGEHMADAATDSYDRDWALAMLSSDQNALYEIDQALARIAQGTYGRCELTGHPIEPARLKAIPWARFSAHAQAELESRGIHNRTQLGPLGNYSSSGDNDAQEQDDAEDSGVVTEKQPA